MAKARLLLRAELDYEEAEVWYRSKSLRVAARFEEAVDLALERIADNPFLYALIDDEHRICHLRKFHHLLIYRYDSNLDEVVVVAIPYEGRSSPSR